MQKTTPPAKGKSANMRAGTTLEKQLKLTWDTPKNSKRTPNRFQPQSERDKQKERTTNPPIPGRDVMPEGGIHIGEAGMTDSKADSAQGVDRRRMFQNLADSGNTVKKTAGAPA